MRARLKIENGQPANVFDLKPDESVTLGRSRANGIVLEDEHASRQHAKVQFTDGEWRVADLESRNGTRLDGQPVRREMPLANGSTIEIGSTVLRFSVEGADTPTNHYGPATEVMTKPLAPSTSTAQLHQDELGALCRFMAAAVEDDDPAGLLHRALKAIHRQTAATMVGYLGLDADDPVPKLVLPESATVDYELSRQLTLKVQRDARPVWLGRDVATPTESLVPFTDALGLPVKAGGRAIAAVHVYRINFRFTERDISFCEALVGSLSGFLQMLLARRSLAAENSRLRAHRPDAEVLLGESAALQRLREQVAKAAPQKFTCLISGESGVGKELVAVALHGQSPRARGPLIVVNCATIAPTMMEAELFGYRKGAFSGAERDYPGMFQQADDGTLFFDEIAELPAECQSKLLRVIEGKPFRPLGATAEIKPDVRIIAATNRDLDAEVRAGRFRSDLYFRLKSLTLVVPPLREHPGDIALIAADYLRRLGIECRKSVKLTPAAQAKLQAYRWPGNVRQLQRVLEHAVVNAESEELEPAAFYLADEPLTPTDLPIDLEQLERVWAIPEALKRTSGNKTQAAKLLGVTRETLAKKVEKYGLAARDD